MNETLTVQAKEVKIKEGAKNGKPWKSRLLVDSNDDFIGSTLGTELDEVRPGQTLEVERERNGDYWNIVSVKPAAEGAVTTTPPLGTGQYVRAKTAADDDRAYNARRALQDAVASFAPRADFPGEAVLELAEEYYGWLMSKTAAAAPQEASGGVQGASELPAEPGQLDEIQSWIKILDKDYPASADPNWKWLNETLVYCKKNFGNDLVSQSTKAQAEQVRAWLETRKQEREAEEKIAF